MPQILIKLNLRCDSLVATENGISFSARSDSLNSDEILYSKTVTNLHIIIVDINDNSPVFTNPSADNLLIGFPDVDLAEQVKPQNLIQVNAFDLDDGLNAKIQFSLENYEHFTINSESGVVYPVRNCMQNVDQVTIVVKATDLDGSLDGNVARVSLIVVKIRAENVVELNIEDERLENIPTVISEMSESSGIDLRLINYFAVPTVSEVESRQSSEESKIIVYVYAFDNLQTVLEARAIIDILLASEVSGAIVFSQFNLENSECNLTGWIVAVSVLGGLLLIISIIAPLVWFLWLRYKLNGSPRRSSSSSEKKLDEDFDTQSGETSPPVAAIEITTENEIRNENETYQNDAEILGIQIDGVTQGELTLCSQV